MNSLYKTGGNQRRCSIPHSGVDMPTFLLSLLACFALAANVALGSNYPVLLTVDKVKASYDQAEELSS